MKKIIIASALSLALSSAAFASPMDKQDMEELFGTQAQTANVVQLSEQEMKSTEGEWVNFAIGAGVSGAIYTASALYNGNWNAKGFGWSLASGALGGGVAGSLIKYSGATGASANILRANGFTRGAALNFVNPWSPWR